MELGNLADASVLTVSQQALRVRGDASESWICSTSRHTKQGHHICCVPGVGLENLVGETERELFFAMMMKSMEYQPRGQGNTWVQALGGEMENFSPFVWMWPRVFCLFGEYWGCEREAGRNVFPWIYSKLTRWRWSSRCSGQSCLGCFLRTAPGTSHLKAPFEIDQAVQKHLNFGEMEGTLD